MGLVKIQWLEEQERGWSSFDDVYVCAKCFDDEALKSLIVKTPNRASVATVAMWGMNR
jgi:hypothetical protein